MASESPRTRVLVTGAGGFIGSNLVLQLRERGIEFKTFERGQEAAQLRQLVSAVDAVVHLAGVNRPADPKEFEAVNLGLTQALCEAIGASGCTVRLVLSSSAQAELDNPYGRSKRAAEGAVEALSLSSGCPVAIYRLPGVFGKWCRPDYNSVVATFCHRIPRGMPIRVDDPAARLRLVYVDDVVERFIADIMEGWEGFRRPEIEPVYETTVGDLEKHIRGFGEARSTLMTERVGSGFMRALHATYLSYLTPAQFAYDLKTHADPRGRFTEMLRTPDCGQFSYFTAGPGVTRGGHYHHTKSEKFLVVSGEARFRFRHALSGETYEVAVSGSKPQVVETVPGWAHDVTNMGSSELVVMLWANEVFDQARPDTVPCALA
jgi:UDP-2-acetamido-2,6-beta-L-arabino-hexul-4-ose reductase